MSHGYLILKADSFLASSNDSRSTPQLPKPKPAINDSVFAKVAIVTGAGAGIGLQICRAYAEAGADVAMFYNSNVQTEKTAEDLAKEFGVKVKAYKCPVNDSKIVAETVNQVERDFGRLDIFVANAGRGGSGLVTDMSDETFHDILETNYASVFYCARAAGNIFKRQGSGNFIITSSMSARIVNIPSNQAVYNSTKAAITHLGISLAVEWKDFARVNIVSPGFVDTALGAGSAAGSGAQAVKDVAYNMAVLGREADARELKGVYLYLASDASTFTTGSDIAVDGGYTLP
ncbi:hypothetical protein PLICRDRAFT_49885 [Plicaturopsis crispa FD-325 SS-3]|nr:hypothetical protein PLICRDRAFT_49885 [Plicaturopsis crispa FD-325 SS-3]